VRFRRQPPAAIAAIRVGDIAAVVVQAPRIPTPPPPPPGPRVPTLTVEEVETTVVTIQPITTIDMAPTPPSAVAASGWVRITDILAQDGSAVYDKVWQDPGATIVQSATTTTPDVTTVIEASYPLIMVNGTTYNLAKTAGYYVGNIDVSLGATGGSIEAQVVTGDDEDGAVDTTVVTVEAPPQLLALSFTGGYPGGQTELKAGDTFQITGTANTLIDAVAIEDFGACSASIETFAASPTFTVTCTIADRGTTVQVLGAGASS
jgi:hypothetical protein